ncbi:MAG: ATP-binding cassette domain-containing protein [Halobacteriovoraceae bacterium]|nr:ATP-binding cassette domain-containing protein [Halobacteriovoraceae bacterium]
MIDSNIVLEIINLKGSTELIDNVVHREESLSFELNRNEIGLILGGKRPSQLLRLILGNGEIQGGSIKILGKELFVDPSLLKGQIRWRKHIGFAFRDKGLLSNLTILENVDLPAKFHGYYNGRAKDFYFAQKALKEINVPEELWNRRPHLVSWTIVKRTLLARSVVLSPDILLLDDPSSLFSTIELPEILNWIKIQKIKGSGILIGTNDYPFGLSICDWFIDPKSNMKLENNEENLKDNPWYSTSLQFKSLMEGQI